MPPWLRKLPWEIVPILLIMLGPAIKAVLTAAAKKRKEREALLSRERAEIDALRTGRKVINEVSAMEDLETMAASRPSHQPGSLPTRAQPRPAQSRPAQAAQRPPRAQTQRASAQPSVRVPSTTRPAPIGTRVVRLPGGLVLELPPDPQQPPQSQARTQARAQPRPPKAASGRDQKPAPAPSRAERSPIVASEISTPTVSERKKRRMIGLPTSTLHWRQAMVMKEILSPPVSMR